MDARTALLQATIAKSEHVLAIKAFGLSVTVLLSTEATGVAPRGRAPSGLLGG